MHSFPVSFFNCEIYVLLSPPSSKMHAVLRYLSAAANRFSHAASVSADGSIIAFGSHKFVAIWDLQGAHHSMYPITSAPLIFRTRKIDEAL